MIAVFDVGNVLIHWNQRNLYRKLFTDEAAMEAFLATVCTDDWNLERDKGATFKDGVAELVAKFPDKADLIRAFDERWQEMVTGPIEGSVAILRELKAAGEPVYAITNFSAEKFAETLERFDFFGLFDGILVSATERMVKPDPRLYRLLESRYGLSLPDTVFIDDSAKNIAGAEAVGMQAIHFTDAAILRTKLRSLGFPLVAAS